MKQKVILKYYFKQKDYKAAVIYADEIVRTSQPSSMISDMSKLQARQGMMKLFTMFMTWTSQFQNRLMEAYGAVRTGKVSPMELAKFAIIEAAIPTFIRFSISTTSGAFLTSSA